MAERKDRECERTHAEVAKKRTAMGYKMTRRLNLAEGREFLASGMYPASALAASTFVASKRLETLPQGAVCMCCGCDLSGKPGMVVEISTSGGKVYKTICPSDYETVVSGKGEVPESDESESESDPGEQSKPTQRAVAATQAVAATATAAATWGDEDEVSAALRALTAAMKKPKAPPVDEAKIIAEAVEAAKAEAKTIMQKSIADFIREGGAAATMQGGEETQEETQAPPAKGSGVDAAEKASSWSARASVPAKNAVEKLNKFLSEFSYFRSGVSMRLVNTFARAADKKEALKSYCEVSQMEDLPDLLEKMKSPEFAEVVKAFAALGKTPQPLNKRFAVFYGPPGGGKTYAAIKAGESINGGSVDTVPCSAGMDAADMLYAYRLDYKSGKRGYVPTALLTAMVSGRGVVLDEVNLLPMEARMFLQNILDNKSKVNVMGVEIPIRDGFFVLGTMNLETGLGATPLPLPLVDRAAVVREFHTSASQAAVGAGLC